jgi:hypothetical protein
MVEEKIACRTPAKGRDGVTNIPRWKYDAVRAAILDIVHEAGDEGAAFRDLKDAVGKRMPQDMLDRLGSLGWHVTVVKLNMEVEGQLRRVPKVTPQRIVLA